MTNALLQIALTERCQRYRVNRKTATAAAQTNDDEIRTNISFLENFYAENSSHYIYTFVQRQWSHLQYTSCSIILLCVISISKFRL